MWTPQQVADAAAYTLVGAIAVAAVLVIAAGVVIVMLVVRSA